MRKKRGRGPADSEYSVELREHGSAEQFEVPLEK